MTFTVASKERRQLLDEILYFMKNKFGESVLGRPDDITKKANLLLSESESYSLLYMLYKFGYVKSSSDDSVFYVITSEGILFVENGGFAQQFRDEQKKKKKEDLDLTNAENVNETYPLTKFLAWLGAISGVIALILSILKVFGIIP